MKKLGLLPADRKKTLFELEQDRQRKRTRTRLLLFQASLSRPRR
jgi:hypothetical protein